MPRARVIELGRVPLTHVEGWVYVAEKIADREPIAGRLLELAPDIERHELRDDSMRYIAYVPPGSVRRGQSLALSGKAGAATACVSCHGAHLNGVGNVPALAGHSPTYVLRQLLAFQTGTRNGVASQPMLPVVANLKLNDMVDAAAYAATGAAVELTGLVRLG
jgi:cytochrome c553